MPSFPFLSDERFRNGDIADFLAASARYPINDRHLTGGQGRGNPVQSAISIKIRLINWPPYYSNLISPYIAPPWSRLLS